MEQLQHIVHTASGLLWGPYAVMALALVGLFLTLKLRLTHLANFGIALKAAFAPQKSEAGGDISRFQALMVVLAGAIGNGNIAGVATAIVTGGPGAIFWMWVMGLLNMATKYSEAILGFKYRRQLPNGEWAGGPMYYLEYGMKSKGLAWFFAIIAGVAAMSTGPLAQTNSMAVVVHSQIPSLSVVAVGAIIFVLVFLVVIGGIKWIARFAEALTPLKVVLYVGGALYVIFAHFDQIPAAFGLIVTSAFRPTAILGGTAGWTVAMRFGAARGLYATEAGLGTAAIGYSVAKGTNPVRQAMLGVLDVFIITFVTCTMSGLVVIVCGLWNKGLTSTALVATSFGTSLPHVGGYIVMISSLLFGYTNLIGWGWYGEKCFEYVIGTKIIIPYRIIYCSLILFGAWAPVDLVWDYADVMNALQALPNVIGLVALAGVVVAITRQYLPLLKKPEGKALESAAD
ncbi:MAG TPA: amino acid carrier protein [Blastocatellia bacterium]|nr:amino acid carrier protein [Blastocatellia bacterium]